MSRFGHVSAGREGWDTAGMWIMECCTDVVPRRGGRAELTRWRAVVRAAVDVGEGTRLVVCGLRGWSSFGRHADTVRLRSTRSEAPFFEGNTALKAPKQHLRPALHTPPSA